MKFRGERVKKLNEMQKGKMYVIVHDEFPAPSGSFKNVEEKAYAFVYLDNVVHEQTLWGNKKSQEITYICDLINAPEGESEFKLFETIDQISIDKDESALYRLVQI